MKQAWWIVGAVGLMVTAGMVQAGVIVDDDFDDWTVYPGDPYLSTGSTIGGTPSPWVVEGGCYDARTDGNVSSAPNAFRDYNGDIGRIGVRNRRNLTAAEMSNANVVNGGTPTCVNGTDENPLVFRFALRLGPNTQSYYDQLTGYAELTCGDDRAPTGVTEMSCQVPGFDPPRYNTRYRLNMAGDGNVHRAIAVGQIAWQDQNPCDDGSTNSVSRSHRLTLFDGKTWRYLQASEPGDMHTCTSWNYVTVRIKTSTIEVELNTRYNGSSCAGPANTRTMTIVRQYLGPFTAIKMGGLHDEVNGGCWGQDKVPVDEGGSVIRAYASQQTDMDNVHLAGGEAYDTPGACAETGACCKSDHTCEQLTEEACLAVTGATFQGNGTSCGVAEGRCCADPIVDGDHDGDVDMADFAKFQRCLTIGVASPSVPFECSCFDTDEDGDVDDVDFGNFAGTATFGGCVSGPGIPADITCDDNF